MYATLQDLIDRYGHDELVQLTDRGDTPAGGVDATVAERALDDARQMVDGCVAGRYQVPLSPVPALIRRITCDLARFYLHADEPTETVRDAYKEAVRLLDRIAGGAMQLQSAGVAAPAGTGSAAAFIAGADGPMFGRRPGGR